MRTFLALRHCLAVCCILLLLVSQALLWSGPAQAQSYGGGGYGGSYGGGGYGGQWYVSFEQPQGARNYNGTSTAWTLSNASGYGGQHIQYYAEAQAVGYGGGSGYGGGGYGGSSTPYTLTNSGGIVAVLSWQPGTAGEPPSRMIQVRQRGYARATGSGTTYVNGVSQSITGTVSVNNGWGDAATGTAGSQSADGVHEWQYNNAAREAVVRLPVRQFSASAQLPVGFYSGFVTAEVAYEVTATAAPDPKDWTIGTAIAGGNMISPQDQRVSPAVPETITVAPGGTLSCEVEAASDSDHWTQGSTAGDAADTITYDWFALGGTITLDTTDSRKATWTAPQQAGTYTLTCRMDDQWTTGETGVTAPETGTRNDNAIERSVTVTVREPITVRIIQSDATPNPALVGEEVTVNLASTLEGAEGCQFMQGPTWSWETVSVEYRATENDSWSTNTPGYTSTIAWVSGEATARHYYIFQGKGQWRIKVKATANYQTADCGNGPASGEAYVGKPY